MLPDVGEKLAADFLLAGLVAREDAARGGEDGDPKSSKDTGNFLAANIASKTGTADASEASDGRSLPDIAGGGS